MVSVWQLREALEATSPQPSLQNFSCSALIQTCGIQAQGPGGLWSLKLIVVIYDGI